MRQVDRDRAADDGRVVPAERLGGLLGQCI